MEKASNNGQKSSMEKASNNGQNGGVSRLPPGFRFHPTDEELVVHYLRRKIFSLPLPAAIIPEVDLARLNPWELQGGCKEAKYVFNAREAKYRNGNRSNRAGRSGFWKATGKDKDVLCSRTNRVVGIKKVLVFYKGKPFSATRTDYVMHEYHLVGPEPPLGNDFVPGQCACVKPTLMVPTGGWVLCRIFKKKRAERLDDESEEDQAEGSNGNGRIPFIDFMGLQDRRQNPSSASELPDSSCVTEHCDEPNAGEETS